LPLPCQSKLNIVSHTAVMAFFSATPTHPLQKASDKIVPLHFFDDGPLWRAFILYSMFVFDCHLDAEKLHSSLERLVHKNGWWKLGARLRRDVGDILPRALADKNVGTDPKCRKTETSNITSPRPSQPIVPPSHTHTFSMMRMSLVILWPLAYRRRAVDLASSLTRMTFMTSCGPQGPRRN
jgi:hypothetical protein